MLLTLALSTLKPLISPRGRAKPRLDLLDVPAFAHDNLGLNGLIVDTQFLSGAGRSRLEALRDRADKAGCSCLVLVEAAKQALAAERSDKAEAAVARVARIIEAAHILGCNAAAVSIEAPDDDAAFERTRHRIREVLETAERLEVNLLISPCEGLTASPGRVTELIKDIGRFRVMTYPDMERAAATDEPQAYLRRLVPYAGAICASTVSFAGPGGDEPDWESLDDPPPHAAYQIGPMVETILSVGYDGPLAIDYRGKGDPELGVLLTRAALEEALEAAAE